MTPDEAFDEVDGATLEVMPADIASDIGLPRIKDDLDARERTSPYNELAGEQGGLMVTPLRVKSEREESSWEHGAKKRPKLEVRPPPLFFLFLPLSFFSSFSSASSYFTGCR